MTTYPDEIPDNTPEVTDEEEEIEIEEGEIVTEDDVEDFADDDDELDVPTLMTSLLATEEGETVCTALLSIGQQLQIQNKILIKILSELKN